MAAEAKIEVISLENFPATNAGRDGLDAAV